MYRPLVIAACGLTLVAAGALSVTAAAPLPAQSNVAQTAAVETRAFAIDNMTCALCPLTVKTAMQRVEGVRSVTVDFGAKTATVAFDPAVAIPEAIAAASTDAGYLARPVG